MSTDRTSLDLPPDHGIELAIVCPQIAPNTGNIARTCVATGTRLHLVRPFGFTLTDRDLKRAGMDYWDRLTLAQHDDIASFRASMEGKRLWLFDSTGRRNLFDVAFQPGDVLVFGSETRGLDPAWLEEQPDQTVRIPQVAGERCLNLATSAAVGLYVALDRSTG